MLLKSWRSLSPRRSRKRRATISRNFRISQSFPDQLTSFINLISFQKPFPRRVNFKMSIDDRNTEFNLWSVRSSSKVQSSKRRLRSVGNKYTYHSHWSLDCGIFTFQFKYLYSDYLYSTFTRVLHYKTFISYIPVKFKAQNTLLSNKVNQQVN